MHTPTERPDIKPSLKQVRQAVRVCFYRGHAETPERVRLAEAFRKGRRSTVADRLEALVEAEKKEYPEKMGQMFSILGQALRHGKDSLVQGLSEKILHLHVTDWSRSA